MMDMLSIVPYYTCSLAKAIQDEGVSMVVGAMTYDLDKACFKRFEIKNNPGLLDYVGRSRVSSTSLRRAMKVAEESLNLLIMSLWYLKSRPDIIHIQHLPLFAKRLPIESLFLWYARKLGIKLVYTVHNVLPHDTGANQKERFGRLYRTMDRIICHSQPVQQRLVAEFGVDPQRTDIIPHGPLFRVEQASQMPCADPVNEKADCLVVCHGMIRPYKGVDFLLEVWSRVESMGIRTRLVIAGLCETQYANELISKAKNLGLQSVYFDFRFLPVEEMLALLGDSDILVYPYREITTSGALMTGIAQRKAIVASDLIPFRQVLRSGESGLLIPYGDAERWARALAQLAGDASEREKMARASKTAILDDDWSAIAQKTIHSYRQVMPINSRAGVPHGQLC